MSLVHNKYSGFFPFNISHKQDWDAGGFNIGNSIFSDLQLQTLVKTYWLAKSFDYSIDISYTIFNSDSDEGSNTDTGTVTGSGTVILPGGASYILNPYQRALGSSLAPVGLHDGAQVLLPATANGTYNGPDTGGIPLSYSQTNGFVFDWNQLSADSFEGTPGYIARDFTVMPAIYYTAIYLAGSLGYNGTDNIIEPVSSSNGVSPPPNYIGPYNFFTLTVDGITVPTGNTPLLVFIVNPETTFVSSLTGTITINFNNFYTP